VAAIGAVHALVALGQALGAAVSGAARGQLHAEESQGGDMGCRSNNRREMAASMIECRAGTCCLLAPVCAEH
jgi:hypothetical protein